MGKLILLSILSFLFLCFKCENNELVKQDILPFNLENSTVQKFIPGQPEEENKYKIKFSIHNKDTFYIVDSVFWNARTFVMPSQNNGKYTFSEVSQNELRVQEYIDNFSKKEFLLFYSKEKKVFYYRVNQLKELTPIVLP